MDCAVTPICPLKWGITHNLYVCLALVNTRSVVSVRCSCLALADAKARAVFGVERPMRHCGEFRRTLARRRQLRRSMDAAD